MTLREQLLAAFERSGLSLVDLCKRLEDAGWPISTVSLSRKLRGLQTLRAGECEAIARALGVAVASAAPLAAAPPGRKRRERSRAA